MVVELNYNLFENIRNYIATTYTYILHRRFRLALGLWIVIAVLL